MAANNQIGMSVPGASDLMPAIGDQVANETEEQRKKRLQNIAASKQLPVGASSLAPDYGSALSMT